jgi:osmotically-inducible protein OsmY
VDNEKGEKIMKQKTDSEIRTQVLRELKWDARLGWAEISVTVTEGIVTLEGEVTSYAKRLAAQDAAHRVAGVLDVVNEVGVRPAGTFIRSDEDVARAVRTCLEWDALVPDERIKSTVSNGWVTLQGDVDTRIERDDAEQSVLRLQGVIGVTNQITIAPRAIDAKRLREQIEEALERRADREAERLRVEVVDDHVNLFGRIHSWQERRAVLGSIKNAPGVHEVHDYMRIDPNF